MRSLSALLTFLFSFFFFLFFFPSSSASGAVNKNGRRDVGLGMNSVGRPPSILKLTQDELHYIL